MTPKEKFWAKFKKGDKITKPNFDLENRVEILRGYDNNKFFSTEYTLYPYDRPWKLWTPPAKTKTKNIVMKSYARRSASGYYVYHAEQQRMDDIPATFNPSDGTYSIEVEEKE